MWTDPGTILAFQLEINANLEALEAQSVTGGNGDFLSDENKDMSDTKLVLKDRIQRFKCKFACEHGKRKADSGKERNILSRRNESLSRIYRD